MVAEFSLQNLDGHGQRGIFLGSRKSVKEISLKMQKLYGDNWREDVKIRLFLDNVRSQSAIMPRAGFLRSN